MGAIAIKAEQTVQEWGNGLAVRLTAPVARAPWVPERRDIIWIDFNPQVDREMKDMHPMLVLSPRAFNDRTSIVIGLPMTTATYNVSNPRSERRCSIG